MPEPLEGSLYDYPQYYDLLFGWDCQAELRLLRACFERFAGRRVRRVFEPACGSGRLLIRLARAGYDVSGNDLNPLEIAYCNARFERNGLPPAAIVGDMADFRLRRRVDAAFCLINSFRYLPTERAARSHLECIAAALAPGGLYILGLHLTPTVGPRDMGERWSAARGHLAVTSDLRSIRLDRRRRIEELAWTIDIYTPTRHRRIEDTMRHRTYTARQLRRLLAGVPELELVETFDFTYDVDRPITIDATTEDVVLVLIKSKP